MSVTSLWYQKYKPDDLTEFVWRDSSLRDKVLSWVDNHSSMPHLILEGPPGTGKTTLAELIVKQLGLNDFDYLFLCTNKHSGVDSIKENVTEFCELIGWNDIKIVIIDEADGLSIPAQDKLRGVINEYGDDVRCIFTCNKVNAISSALKSRARVYKLHTLDIGTFTSKLMEIVEKESISISSNEDEQAFTQLIDDSFPDLRKAIDLLQDSSINVGDGTYSFRYDKVNGSISNTVESAIRESLSNGSIQKLRDTITGMPRSTQEEIYTFLYENSSDLFHGPDIEQTAIVLIANYLKDHDTVAFPEINLAALFCELITLQK